MQRKQQQQWTVSGRDAEKSLQDFLAQSMGVSRRVAKQQVDARVVWVNGRCVWMARHSLKRGDEVRLTTVVASPTALSNVPKKLTVIFEDDDFLAVDKPVGILANDSDKSAEAIMRRQTGNPDLRAVHRLDRDTTGCLLMAKSAEAKDAAVNVFRQHQVTKVYRAIVYSRWDAKTSTLDLPIEGEHALTHVTCVRANDKASYLIVRIETGRTHQIRRHLAMARHPVLGDREYGPKAVLPEFQDAERAMLHAVELMLTHPTKPDKILKMFSPIPKDMHHWLNVLKLQ